MFKLDWLILRILHQSFEIERPKGHWSDIYIYISIRIRQEIIFTPFFIKNTVCFHSLHCLFIRKS